MNHLSGGLRGIGMGRRQLARGFAPVFACLVATAVLVAGAPQAGAAATITISGTVACDYGHAVEGVWVQSSGGGSGFASWQAVPGFTPAPWVAFYSKNVQTSL